MSEDVTRDVLASAELELELAHSVSKPVFSSDSPGSGLVLNSLRLSSRKASRMDDEEDLVSKNAVISSLFSTRKPRDISSALGSGIKSLTKGVVIGATSLVLCPVVGVSNEGLTGFFKGVGAGVLAAVTLPLAGVGVSLYQVGRGLVNTPSAICHKASGKVWNKETRTWENNWYSLEEEVQSLRDYLHHNHVQHNTNSVNTNSNTMDLGDKVDPVETIQLDNLNDLDDSDDPVHSVKNTVNTNTVNNSTVNSTNVENGVNAVNINRVFETELYETLQVPVNASQETIRKAYYRLAKKYHPDKCPEGCVEEVNERFHRLGEAYQILGDEERRKRYDKYGRSAVSEMPILDAQLFFAMLFGSDALEPFIGKLRMALYMELELRDELSPTMHDFERLQQAREVEVALRLRDFLRPFVCGELDVFRESVADLVRELCVNSFSLAVVETLGWTYENYARQYIGKKASFLGISGRIAKSSERSRRFRKGFRTFTSLLKTAILERGHRRNCDENEPLISDVGVNFDQKSIPVILDAMLNICLMDIQSTVRAACKRVLRDMSVDASWRFRRAEALLEVGRIFLQVARERKQEMETGPEEVINNTDTERRNVHYSNEPFF